MKTYNDEKDALLSSKCVVLLYRSILTSGQMSVYLCFILQTVGLTIPFQTAM